MPALTPQQPSIRSAILAPAARPVHPSPTLDGLRLEVMSGREIAYWGQRFAIDTPYYIVPLGWGEWAPAIGS